MYAFRCKTCGHLHAAAHAGENALPNCCIVCGAGGSFTPAGIRQLHHENWEVLAVATPERLTELGLTAADVVRHAPDVAASYAANLASSEREVKALLARKEKWHAKPLTAWQQELDALYAQHDATAEEARGPHRETIKALCDSEWTTREEELLTIHQQCIAREGKPHGQAPQALLRNAREASATVSRPTQLKV